MGGDGRLSRLFDLAEALLDMLDRRPTIGIPCGNSAISRTAATITALFVDTLFRRVTRWFDIRDPVELECGCTRLFDLGKEAVVIESRRWPRGLEGCWISLDEAIVTAGKYTLFSQDSAVNLLELWVVRP